MKLATRTLLALISTAAIAAASPEHDRRVAWNDDQGWYGESARDDWEKDRREGWREREKDRREAWREWEKDHGRTYVRP